MIWRIVTVLVAHAVAFSPLPSLAGEPDRAVVSGPWTQVVTPHSGPPTVRPHPPVDPPVIYDPGLPPLPSRPRVHVPAPTVVAEPRPSPAQPRPTVGRTKGRATWYCGGGPSTCTAGAPASGLYAAAGKALRVGKWRGRKVTVIASNGKRVVVTLVDTCACGKGRVIDLYASAFRRLAPLSKGVLRVTVKW